MVVVQKELYHHGILGMKWGISNGPPYPLDSKDHSASEKKAGWRKSLSGNSSEAKKKKEQAKARKAEIRKAKKNVAEEKRQVKKKNAIRRKKKNSKESGRQNLEILLG